VIPSFGVGIPAIVPAPRVRRVDPNRLGEVGDGRVDIADFGVSLATVVVGERRTSVPLHRRGVIGDRVQQLAQNRVSLPAFEENGDVRRIEFERYRVISGGQLVLTGKTVRVAAGDVACRAFSPRLDCRG
jgi:hypothetical protein